MASCFIHRVVFVVMLLSVSGCRMGVPIHVWQPPILKSTVGKRVVLETVAGPVDTAEPIRDKLLAMVPQDRGRATTIVQAGDLQGRSTVQVASASDIDPSDVELASLARQQSVDFLLRGEVLEQFSEVRKRNEPLEQPTQLNQLPEAKAETDDNPRLTLSWRLTAIGQEPSSVGQPIVVDLESALERYPDLAILNDPNEILSTAVVRETYRLITPSVDRQRVQLGIAYFTLGSKEVQRGNIAALAGRWAEAEKIWTEVLDRHPLQITAIHNLALAAVAGQDFSRAKKLARKAIRLQPTPLHRKTLVWIELRQRDYHKSFDLPDPPEGWFVTH